MEADDVRGPVARSLTHGREANQIALVVRHAQLLADGAINVAKIIEDAVHVNGDCASSEVSLQSAQAEDIANYWNGPVFAQATPKLFILQSIIYALHGLQESFHIDSHSTTVDVNPHLGSLGEEFYMRVHAVLCYHVLANVSHQSSKGDMKLDDTLIEQAQSCMIWVLMHPRYWQRFAADPNHSVFEFGTLACACMTLCILSKSKRCYKLSVNIVERQLRPFLTRYARNTSDLSLLASLLCVTSLFPLVLAPHVLDRLVTTVVELASLDPILPAHRHAVLLITRIVASLSACKNFNSTPFIGSFCDAAMKFEAQARTASESYLNDTLSIVQPLTLVLSSHKVYAAQWALRMPKMLSQGEAQLLMQPQPQMQMQMQMQMQVQPPPQVPQVQMQPQMPMQPQPHSVNSQGTVTTAISKYGTQFLYMRACVFAKIRADVTHEIMRRAEPSISHHAFDWSLLPCDLDLIVGPTRERIPAVKCMLMMVSPYVRALFSGAFEAVTEMSLPQLTVEGVRAMLDFVASPSPVVRIQLPREVDVLPWVKAGIRTVFTLDQAIHALHVADFFNMDVMFDALETALCEVVSVDTIDQLCAVAVHFDTHGSRGWKLKHFTSMHAIQNHHRVSIDSLALQTGIVNLARSFYSADDLKVNFDAWTS
jgi:hypothetical protein